MNETPSHVTRSSARSAALIRGSALIGIASLVATAHAQPTIDLPPNLTPFPAFGVSLVTNTSGDSTLRFSTTSWNNGTGALELVTCRNAITPPPPDECAVDPGPGKQRVFQQIYLSNGEWFFHNAGSFAYHADHFHIHFDDYALYTLQPVNAPGGSALTGSKVTFCIMDTTKVDTRLPGAPPQPVYTSCGPDVQGMSIGWGDTYGSHLPGQEIDFTDAPDGIYALRIEIDPKHLLIESNESDNESCALLSITKPSTVTALDISGNCSAVASISPSSAQIGATVQVTIAGYGFTQGMAVSFAGGNGPRPVASNVQLASDTEGLDMITATVTVPGKRKGGRDPVWDVRVGEGGVLRDGFTVTP